MFFVFKKPFMYAVAGYGVFNWVNGGVMRRIVIVKSFNLIAKLLVFAEAIKRFYIRFEFPIVLLLISNFYLCLSA